MILAAVAAAGMHAQTLPALPRSPDLYVSGFFAASIHRYFGPRNAVRGAKPVSPHAGAVYAQGVVRRPWGIAFGPDGNLYVANVSGGSPAIVRVDGPFSATPGMSRDFVASGAFYDLAFGPDGNLYAAGRGAVRRYDLVTGEQIDEFTRGHALVETRGIAFGPDGLLYVSNYDGCPATPSGCGAARGEIVRFDALTGEFVDVWLRGGEGGLTWPWKIAFSATGDLLIVNWTPSAHNTILLARIRPRASHHIRRAVAPTTSVLIARDAWFPLYVATGPDGHIYVSDSAGAGAVLRFHGRTGAFLDAFVAEVEGSPRGIAFAPGAQ